MLPPCLRRLVGRYAVACLFLVFMFQESHAATTLEFTFAESPDLMTHAATARFSLDPDNSNHVFLELTNNSLGITHSATDVLLGLFFVSSSHLTPVSAELLGGSTVIVDPPQSIEPGDGWELRNDISIAGYNTGVAAAGYGVFGPDGNLNPGGNPQILDGSDYGLVGRNFDPSQVNASVKSPLFNNGLRFTFQVPPGFDLNSLGNVVRFQYGTSLDEPSFNVDPPPSHAPEPSTLCLGGMAGLFAVMRWLNRHNQARAS